MTSCQDDLRVIHRPESRRRSVVHDPSLRLDHSAGEEERYMDTYASSAIAEAWERPLSAWINYIRPVFMSSKPTGLEEMIHKGNPIQFVGQDAQFIRKRESAAV